jgi:hypothetical protein
MRKLFSLCLVLISVSTSLDGQHYSPGLKEADPDWLEQYLYNGVEWRPGFPLVTGHEFFLTKEYVDADITLEGISFKNVRLRYDICSDKVIILWKATFPIALSKERIDEFTIRHEGIARRFVNFRHHCPEFRGFAEVLYAGSSTFVARYTKVVSHNSSLSSYAQFRDYTKYYYMINGSCYQIRNRKTFLNLMGDNEAEVKRFIRQNNILMSSFSPSGFGIAAAFYDSLVAKEVIE